MKFYAEPNLYVKVVNKRLSKRIKGFKFNDKGEFETADEALINLMKPQFKYEDIPFTDIPKDIPEPEEAPKEDPVKTEEVPKEKPVKKPVKKTKKRVKK